MKRVIFERYYTAFLVGILIFTAIFRVLDARHTISNLPKTLSPTKRFAALFRLMRMIVYPILLVPVLPTLWWIVQYTMDPTHVYLPFPNWYSTQCISIAGNVVIASLVFELVAKPKLPWSTAIHHTAVVIAAIVATEYRLGDDYLVFQTVGSLLETPLDYALYLHATCEGDTESVVVYAQIASWTFSATKILLQFPTLAMFSRLYAVEPSLAFRVGFPILNAALCITQLSTTRTLQRIATRYKVKAIDRSAKDQ